MTAVILTSIFGEFSQKWIIYVGEALTIACTLDGGLYLLEDNDKNKKNKIMGALIMFALAIIIAAAAVLYYWRQDRKEKKTPKAE